MTTNLKNLIVGDCGKITGFVQSGKAYRKRLLAMGLTPGTEFKVTRFAPMGDPVEIKLRGFSLSLRKDEASILLIEKLNAS
jgi:ferrous iron transport protein A